MQTNKPNLGTGFVNLKNILNANKSNTLGEQLRSNIENQTNQFNTEVNNANQKFETDYSGQENNLNNFQNRFNEIVTRAKNVSGDTYKDTPDQFKDDANTVNTYKTTTYGGPSGIDQYSTLKNRAEQLQNTGKNLNTVVGRGQALQGFIADPNYTRRQQILDGMYLGDNVASIKAAGRETRGLTNQLDSAQSNAEQKAQTLSSRYNDFNKSIDPTLQTEQQNVKNEITNNVTNQQTKANELNKLFTLLQDETLNKAILNSPDIQGPKNLLNIIQQSYNRPDFKQAVNYFTGGNVLKGLGSQLTPTQWEYLQSNEFKSMLPKLQDAYKYRSINLNDLVNPFNSDLINKETVISPQEYARLAALSTLRGDTTDLPHINNVGLYDQSNEVNPSLKDDYNSRFNEAKTQATNYLNNLTVDPKIAQSLLADHYYVNPDTGSGFNMTDRLYDTGKTVTLGKDPIGGMNLSDAEKTLQQTYSRFINDRNDLLNSTKTGIGNQPERKSDTYYNNINSIYNYQLKRIQSALDYIQSLRNQETSKLYRY